MSEGTNVLLWARALHPLLDQPLTEVKLPRQYAAQAEGLVGVHLAAVHTHGKHLLLRLSDGRTLHCHGMLAGEWYVAPVGARGHPESAVFVRLRTAGHEAVFLHGPVAELLTPEDLAAHPRLTALGPDVMHEHFDREEAWRRMQAYRGEIADALLDQTVVAGLGNVYKAEGLFLAGVHPQRRAAEVTRAEVEALWDAVVPLMWQEVHGPRPWTTLPPELRGTGEQHWVYGRADRPCLRCRVRIVCFRQGRYRRATYYCPRCQSLPTDPGQLSLFAPASQEL